MKSRRWRLKTFVFLKLLFPLEILKRTLYSIELEHSPRRFISFTLNVQQGLHPFRCCHSVSSGSFHTLQVLVLVWVLVLVGSVGEIAGKGGPGRVSLGPESHEEMVFGPRLGQTISTVSSIYVFINDFI